MLIKPDKLCAYVEGFTARDGETAAAISNAAEWMSNRVPLLDCPDADIERTFYFRWWTYRKHIRKTPEGHVITEFLPPVPWAGKYNAISCAAGHHLYEGRWLKDTSPLADYARFWYRGGGALHDYSNWLPDALYKLCLTTGDMGPAVDLLPDLVADEAALEREHLHTSGLYWSEDGRDGGEFSISGPGLRTTMNCYRWAAMRAISAIAGHAGKPDIQEEFYQKAETLGRLIFERLWDEKAGFFRCIPLDDRHAEVREWSFERMNPALVVRELWGYLPWYFGMPCAGHENAWNALNDPEGFRGEYGPTTAERRHPLYGTYYTGDELQRFMVARTGNDGGVGDKGHECLWNGPSWPFATSQTLTALANHLNSGVPAMEPDEYARLLSRYARSHQLQRPDGSVVPWIDENLHPDTGDWISRTRLMRWTNGGWDDGKGGCERGRDYNHSTFCDHVISGLFGIRPREGGVEIRPLLPDGWEYACLDGVPCRGHKLTVLLDRNGTRYQKGAGFRVLVDGKEAASSAAPAAHIIQL